MGDRCNKCKVSFRVGGDTWCTGCAAWETIGLELCNSWSGPGGLRRIAEDIVLSAARQVRALRAVGAGSSRAPAAGASSGVKAEEEEEKQEKPAPAAAVGGLAAKHKVSQPQSESEEYTYTEEEVEEDEEPKQEAKAPKEIDKRPTLPRRSREGDNKRPLEVTPRPEPIRKVKEELRDDSRRREKDKKDHKEKDRRRREEKKDKEKKERKSEKDQKTGSSKRRRKRGGRKHQRLSTLAEDPFRPHHRKLSDQGLEGRQRLDIEL